MKKMKGLVSSVILLSLIAGCGKNDTVSDDHNVVSQTQNNIEGSSGTEGDYNISEPLTRADITATWVADQWTINGVHHSVDDDCRYNDVPRFESATGEYFILHISADLGYSGLVEASNDGEYLLVNPDENITMRANIYNDEMWIYLPSEDGSAGEPDPKNELHFMCYNGSFDGDLISVERFKYVYEMEDTDIPDDYIEKYIDTYELQEEEVFAMSLNCGSHVQADYEEGKVYGFSEESLNRRSLAWSDPEDLGDPEYIFITLSPSPSGEVRIQNLLAIDYKHMIICYGGGSRNYSDGDQVITADLTEDDRDRLSFVIKGFIGAGTESERPWNECWYSVRIYDTDGVWCDVLYGSENDGTGFYECVESICEEYLGVDL